MHFRTAEEYAAPRVFISASCSRPGGRASTLPTHGIWKVLSRDFWQASLGGPKAARGHRPKELWLATFCPLISLGADPMSPGSPCPLGGTGDCPAMLPPALFVPFAWHLIPHINWLDTRARWSSSVGACIQHVVTRHGTLPCLPSTHSASTRLRTRPSVDRAPRARVRFREFEEGAF